MLLFPSPLEKIKENILLVLFIRGYNLLIALHILNFTHSLAKRSEQLEFILTPEIIIFSIK